MPEKQMLNLLFAGHVDHGKSTLVGRIFYDRGDISPRMLERLQRHAEAAGKATFHFAFFTDQSLQERRRGISVETAYKGFETESRRYNIIDAPGHRDFVKNMISGAVEADAAVLLVDAKETSVDGAAPQTREHLVLLKALGIGQLIVAVNKMDTVGFGQEAFDLCKMEVESFCESIGYDAATHAMYVPISALQGDNVSKSSSELPWYEGCTLLEALDACDPPSRPTDLPLRMPILRTFIVPGIGSVVAGRIETGTVGKGDGVVIAPYPGSGAARAVVHSIQWQHSQVESAAAGDDVGILLTKQEKGFVARQVRKGAVLGTPTDSPRACRRFKAELMVVDHPNGIKVGYSPYLHVHQVALPCRISEIADATDRQGNPKEISDEKRLENGDMAIVWIETERPIVIEPGTKIPRLGRFILRDGRTVATGICLAAEHIH